MTGVRLFRPTCVAPLALMLVLATSCTGPVPVVDFYVDPVSGSDANPGTAAAPFETLNHALGSASEGHTIHLAAGTYDEANGEVWPTQSGVPPVAEPNVPNGVTITSDGNEALLVGPGGLTTTSALVFEGEATVRGVTVSGFLRGILAGQNTDVTLEDVEVTSTATAGVYAYNNASLTILSSELHDNAEAGIHTQGGSTVTIDGVLIHHNSPGVMAGGASSILIRDSDVYSNGTLAGGEDHSGLSVLANAEVTINDTTIRDNAYAGLNLGGSGTVLVGEGTVVNDNYIGVVVDGVAVGPVTLEFDGATIRDNDFEGVYWGASMGVGLRMRNTEVNDNGDNGIFFDGAAAVIDLGTTDDPGNNDYSGNGEPLILDNRPARAAADGTIITASYEDTLTPCLVANVPSIGPVNMTCGGITFITIANANNRVHVMMSP